MPADMEVRQQDVRAEFALRLRQNMEFVRNQARCACGPHAAFHRSPCPVHSFTLAMEIVDNTLQQFNMGGLDEPISN